MPDGGSSPDFADAVPMSFVLERPSMRSTTSGWADIFLSEMQLHLEPQGRYGLVRANGKRSSYLSTGVLKARGPQSYRAPDLTFESPLPCLPAISLCNGQA